MITKLNQIISNCEQAITELDLTNPDKRTKEWVKYRYYKASIKDMEESIKIRNSWK